MTITNKQLREYFEQYPADKESWRLTKRMNRDMIRKKRLEAVQENIVHVHGSNYAKRRAVENGEHRKRKRFKRDYEV